MALASRLAARWELEADCVTGGAERKVKVVHQVTFSRALVQIYVDEELLG